MTNVFVQVEGGSLAQGDYLPDCPIPLFPDDFGETKESWIVSYREGDLIIVTQSCDLENGKGNMVALCPILDIRTLVKIDVRFDKKVELENLRKGRYEGLYMLACPGNPSDNQGVLIVDFRSIYSLPLTFLSRHATKQNKRWRLESPYLEHFSQAFGRFFMRVGLPFNIPAFK
jgi:hypothetical protein